MPSSTKKTATLFVDGRYTVQARAEVEPGLIEVSSVMRGNIGEWLGEHLPRGATVGFDPRLHTIAEVERLEAALKPHGIKLAPTARNLVDRVWGRRAPAGAQGPGLAASDKFRRALGTGQDRRHPEAPEGRQAGRGGADAAATASPGCSTSAAPTSRTRRWRSPSPSCRPAASRSCSSRPRSWSRRCARTSRRSPKSARRRRSPSGLKRCARPASACGSIPNTASYWFARALGGGKRIARGPDPSLALKAIKNAAEIKGSRAAHLRDGLAVTRFLAWLDGAAATGALDEIEAVRRSKASAAPPTSCARSASTPSPAVGPNGAIVHYRVSEATNRKLRPGELFLIDSGAQYLDGTTDITRTVAIGKPTAEMRQRFTLVLKGHIAVASARFPKGTRGIDLDPFARRALWQHGLDYDHGTGHGIGSYLSVHEGPQSISRAGMAVLEPGMICSNEPGYYKEGAYGIRIENLVLVTELTKLPGADRETMGFETLTLAPIDRRLIVKEMLTADEAQWLDGYHARVAAALGPDLDEDARAWLKHATAPL